MSQKITRRAFTKLGALAGTTATAYPTFAKRADAPLYLRGYEQLYATDPRGAALAWFRAARYGLFLHYGEVLSKLRKTHECSNTLRSLGEF